MTIIRTFGEIFGRPVLTVTREAGMRSCVLSGIKNGHEIERGFASPQSTVDYLDAVYPGEIVRWRLMPRGEGAASPSSRSEAA